MKEKLGQTIPSYPMPVSIVGTLVKGKPNFLTIAWFSMVSYNPPMIAVILGNSHYTNSGIKESGCFSLCIPSEDMVKVTDYAGLVSGEDTDKSGLFELFQGETKAPLIKDCPICIECELEKTETIGQNEMFIGRIVQVYADKNIMSGGKIDLGKIRPIIVSQGETQYYKLGGKFEKAWDVGKDYNK